METLESALPFKHCLVYRLDSSELGHPPKKFVKVFDRAGRKVGCRNTPVKRDRPTHLASARPARAERIDHGVRAIEDPP